MATIKINNVTVISESGGTVTLEGTLETPLIKLTPDSAPATTEGAIYYDSTTNVVSVYNGTKWNQLSNVFSATGGTVTTNGGYTIHTFNASASGSNGFIPSTDGFVEYLVIGGGGGGTNGGGGAGGYLTGTGLAVTGGTQYTITIGSGGTGNAASSGSPSSIGSSVIALGGGNGAQTGNNGGGSWMNGGSGGGAPRDGTGKTNVGPGFGVAGQGFEGGLAGGNSCASAGGGGGAGGIGHTGKVDCGATRIDLSLIRQPAEGGVGLSSSINGTATFRGGGGGGCYETSVAADMPVLGGNGGGGDGWDSHMAGADQSTAGAPNTGGGGGGRNTGGKSGGSGVVIIRYLT